MQLKSSLRTKKIIRKKVRGSDNGHSLFQVRGTMKLLFISLGCDKNLVDSEYMIGMLANDGIEMTDDETQADIIIVNSCCFIGDAKEESINTILEMAQY